MNLDVSYHSIPSLKGTHPYTLASKGVFTLGSIVVDDAAMHWVKGESNSGGAMDAAISPNVVVYGCGFEALHVIEKLRQSGTDPTTIVWVYRKRPDFGYEQV